MDYAVVTLESQDGRRRDLALPVTISSQLLAEAVVHALELPADQPCHLAVRTNGEVYSLPSNITLADGGILNGASLILKAGGVQVAARIQGGAFFQTEAGEKLPLPDKSAAIGRSDPIHGIFADIDLTPQDPRKYTSRRHAILDKEERGYVLKDAGSSHGVFVNGRRLELEQGVALREGDVIEFGLAEKGGVRVIFKMD
jgi:hypothetical protein